jgi:hypothetical protein
MRLLLPLLVCLAPGLAQPAPSAPDTNRTAQRMASLPDTSDATRGLDLTGYRLECLYEADFSVPLDVIREEALFDGDRRVRRPAPDQWVLEGRGSARTEKGRLRLDNGDDHAVLWLNRVFPANFLLEFTIQLENPSAGLNLVFFAAAGRDGSDIFALSQPRRAAVFKAYHTGTLDAYHASYWAVDAGGVARGTSHVRKNHGFNLVALGQDFLADAGPGPHTVRVLKVGSLIEIETNGRIAVRFNDDGLTFGPALGAGAIGLRQMSHTGVCAYTRFRVWRVSNL